MTRTWKAKCACSMPWRDFACGETCELDDEAVTDRVKALFVCLNEDEKAAMDEAKREDPTFNVMLQRLKQAKVQIPRGANKAVIERLFRENLEDGSLPHAST